LEQDLLELEAKTRTLRMTGPVRKAFEFVMKVGRADLDRFLQSAWQKPAVQRKLRTLNFEDEADTIRILEELASTFGEESPSEGISTPTRHEAAKTTQDDVIKREVAPLPADRDASLELVCWMHITP
jgi:hypothetical protein